MAKKTTTTSTIQWNGISIEVEWEGDREDPEITGMQLITPSDLMAFADYASGNKNMMDEIEELLQIDIQEIEQDEKDFYKSLKYDR